MDRCKDRSLDRQIESVMEVSCTRLLLEESVGLRVVLELQVALMMSDRVRGS